MLSTWLRRVTPLLTVVALLLAPFNAPLATAANGPVTIQILNVSDWHAQLDPSNGVGGAAVLSTYFKQDRALNPNTLTLTAGDAFGATPPLSGFFNEEPGVRAMRLMGFDLDTFGNHNFDRGVGHLAQMIQLAGSKTNTTPGQPFSYVVANLGPIRPSANEPLRDVRPYKVFKVGGVKVGVVGIINPEAPTLVFPGNFGSYQIFDPVTAANAAAIMARRAGAQVLIAITHLGVTGFDPATGQPLGPVIDFANSIQGYDIVFGDHTDVRYSGVHNGILVVENRSKGLTYARVNVTVNGGVVTNKTVEFVTPTASAVTPDQAIVDMLAPYRTQLAAAFDSKIGVATALFPRGNAFERSGESALGNLIADSMRLEYGTQLALTNGGGIRASLPSSYAPLAPGLSRTTAPFDLVVGDIFTILPFGNSIVTRNVTGAQLWAALENGVSRVAPNITGTACVGTDGRFPQISGFKFTYSCSAPAGARVTSVSFPDGTPIPPDGALYSFATNDFVNFGGDSYTMLADGQGTTRGVMADIFLKYIQTLGTVTPTLEGRITGTP